MRYNVFDSMPSNIISGKDNIFANFLQTAGLYESMKIDEDGIEDLILLLGDSKSWLNEKVTSTMCQY